MTLRSVVFFSAFIMAAATVVVLAATASPVLAADNRVSDRSEFVSLVQGRTLTRFGITLVVSPDGNIGGTAFGRQVTGDWAWRDGFFCRNLNWGGKSIDPDNCQTVQKDGGGLRFTSDRGAGDSAVLSLN